MAWLLEDDSMEASVYYGVVKSLTGNSYWSQHREFNYAGFLWIKYFIFLGERQSPKPWEKGRVDKAWILEWKLGSILHSSASVTLHKLSNHSDHNSRYTYNVLPYLHTSDTLLVLRPGSYYVICITVIITLQRRGRQQQQMDRCTCLIGDEEMVSNRINNTLLGFLTWYSYKQQYPKYFLLRHPWISPSQSNLPTTARLTFLKYCYSWMFVLECSAVYYYLLN